MVIKIETKKVGIPVQIGELEYVVGTSDKDLEMYEKNQKKVIKAFEEVSEATTFDELKEVLEKGFDTLLGAGAFEEIFDQTPSTVECSKYLLALYEGVFEEFEALGQANTQSAKAEKYLKKKKK